tara:strand:- start:5622 stop:10484 length:4863 start_codon:yes stop_codon:yes gene_type:complete
METTQQEQDFSKPLVNPTKGIVTAKEARRKRGLPEPGEFEKTPFVSSGITDYRNSRFASLFNNDDFRNAMLNYNYAEANVNNFDYLKTGIDRLGRPTSSKSILREVDKGTLPDDFLSTQDSPYNLTRKDLQRNVIRPIQLDPSINTKPVGREQEDELINAKLNFMLTNPIQSKAMGNIFSFAIQDGAGNKYVIPMLESSKTLIEEDRQTGKVSYKPRDESADTTKAESQKRFFQLLKNLPKNLDNVKIAELVYAQENGSLEDYRRKHGISDFVKFFPNLAVGTLELATKGVAAMNNHIYDMFGADSNKIDTSKIDFKGLKYGAETFSDMTNGLVTPDGAAAILAYSPDLKTSVGREIGPSAVLYGITLGGGLTIGAIKNKNFRNFVKETYQSNTFSGGLKKAAKQGYTDFDVFDQYWNANNIGFFKNFRKDFSTFTMRMDMEGKAALLGDKRYKDKLLFLKNKLRGEQIKKQRLEEQYKSKPTPDNKILLEKQNKITERIEKNLSNEFAKSNIPSTFTGLFRDEVGAAIGIGTANFMYQRNNVDPEDMLPPLYLSLISGVGGVVATDLGVRGTGSLFRYLNDMRKNQFGFSLETAGQKGRAREALQWISRADPVTQKEILDNAESHRILGDRIANLVDGNGNKIIKNPEALEKTVYDLSKINILQSLSDQMTSTLKYKNITNFDDTFQDFLTIRRERVRVYDQLASAITDLRRAKIHPDIQSDKLASNTIKNYEDMYMTFGKSIDENQKLIDGFVVKLESDLKDMSEGWMVNPKGTDMSVFRNYEKKLGVLREYYVSESLLNGFDPIDAFNESNKRLLKFDQALMSHTKSVGSINQNAPLANALILQNFDNVKSKFKGRGDALFGQLKRDYGINSANPVYADVADFYGVLKRYAKEEGGKLSDFFDPDEFFFAQTSAGTKKALGIKPDPTLSNLSGLFDEAAARYLDPDNVKNYTVEVQRLINSAKESYPDASSFEIWQRIYEEVPEAVDLPVSMDEWRAIAQRMNQKAFQKRGTVQAKDQKSLYDYWQSIAEDKDTGFSFNFFDSSQKTFIGDKAVDDWKAAKGAWHDFKMRYGSGFGKDWGDIIGTTPQGDKILKQPVSKWIETIYKELTSDTFDQAKADELVSKLAQSFGGYNISRDVKLRPDAQFTFAPNMSKQDDVLGTNNEGMLAVQTLIKRVNNLVLLNSPQGRELRTSILKNGQVTVNDLAEIKSNDKYQTFLNNIDLLRVGQDAQGSGGAKFIDKTEIDESNDIIQLVTYSENVKKLAKQFQTNLKKEVENVKAGFKTAEGKIIKNLDNQKRRLTENLTPKGIHDLIKLGQQGIDQLDETRRAYELLVLDKLGVQSVDQLNDKSSYTNIMRDYDKFIAGRVLEHVDNMVRKRNPEVSPKVQLTDPVEGGSIDIKQEDIVDADLLFDLLGQNKEWQGSFREIVNRGLVNPKDDVFDDYLTIAGFMRGDTPLTTRLGVTAVPKGLQGMSMVSRVYALNRGVIGLPYFSTDIAFQAFKKKQLKLFEAMMNDPEIGKIVVDMLRTGEVPSPKDNTRFVKALTNVIARHTVEGETNPELEELNKISTGYEKRRANIEKQMERLKKKDLLKRGTKAVENFVDQTKAFITGEENEAIQ